MQEEAGGRKAQWTSGCDVKGFVLVCFSVALAPRHSEVCTGLYGLFRLPQVDALIATPHQSV